MKTEDALDDIYRTGGFSWLRAARTIKRKYLILVFVKPGSRGREGGGERDLLVLSLPVLQVTATFKS